MRDSSKAKAPATLQKTDFLTDVVVNLVGTSQEVLGYDEAANFVSNVGDEIGAAISDMYQDGYTPGTPAESYIVETCVDLKARLGGQFTAVSVTPGEVVFENTCCPFGDKVVGQPALCMMTTNVFGRVAADANGYARVYIEESIATGQPRCRVCVSLRGSDEGEGYEFYR